MSFRAYNRRRHVHKLYSGIDKNGRTLTVSAYTIREAAAEMRKLGFSPVKVRQT